jgi:hypothetical protein
MSRARLVTRAVLSEPLVHPSTLDHRVVSDVGERWSPARALSAASGVHRTLSV